MENRREEILGLKRLLVGVLVSALLVTMLPIENLRNIVVKADTGTSITSLKDYSVFEFADEFSITDTKDADDNIITTAEEALFQILEMVVDYPNGIIIKNESGRNLDFGGEGLFIPMGLVGIELGDTSIVNVSQIDLDVEGESSLYVLGNGTDSKIQFIEPIDVQNEWIINANQRLVLQGVQVVNADIIVNTNEEYGASFGYDEVYIDLPKQENNTYPYHHWYAIYREGKGVFRYEKYQDVLYVDKLFPEMLDTARETKQFDLKLYGISVTSDGVVNPDSTWRHIYAEDVMKYIASEVEGCTLSYFGTNYFVNPEVTLYINDDERGVYTITEEDDGAEKKKVIRIYEFHNAWTDIETDNTTGSLEIRDKFYEGNSQAEETYDKVIFEEGAIATTFETEIQGELITVPIKNIVVEHNTERDEPEFIFDLSNNDNDVQFFNRSDASITINDNDANSANELWSMWSAEVSADTIVSGGETTEYNEDTFAKAGSVFKFTPPENNTFRDIHIGDFYIYPDSSPLDYYYYCGKNMANSNLLQINKDGSMELTMPSRMLKFYAASVEIEELELGEPYVTIDKEPISLASPDNGTYDTYVAPITVIAKQETEYSGDDGISFSGALKRVYEIATTDSDEGWTNSIVEMEAGEGRTVVYYVIDRSMQKESEDENGNGIVDEIPADTYGQITKLTYTYTLTRLAPTEDMYQIEAKEAVDGWSKEEILITGLNGNTLSTTEEGPYTETLSIREEVEEFTFYIKTEDGEITSAVVLSDVQMDTTAPEVLYTDAHNSTATELVAGESYEGNLYINIQDAGVGFDSVALYKVENGEEVLCANKINYLGTTGQYYIAPETEDVTYKIVVADKLGNERVYENITLKGYSQDIRVEVGKAEGYYGKDLIINITIYNESENEVAIRNQALRTDGTDSEFSKEFGSMIGSIPAGESASTTITLESGANVGEYLATLDITYLSVGDSDETSVEKVLSQEIIASIEKVEGTGSVKVYDFCYGEKMDYEVQSDSHGTENVTLFFKEADNETAEFTQDIPTKVGTYIVKAVFAETENYLELVVDDTFVINRIAATQDMYVVSTETGEDNWYVKDIVISAKDGYALSFKEDGTFTKELTISELADSYTFYVQTESGAITEAVVLVGMKIDKTAPEIGENEGIYAAKTWWQKFLEVITFSLYEAETDEIKIVAHDYESGIKTISYYISPIAISAEEIENVTDWVVGDSVTVHRDDYEQYIVYAKIENEAGLASYISSDGIKLKETEPSVEPEDPADEPEDPADEPEDPEDEPEDPKDEPEDPKDEPEVPEDEPEVPEDEPEVPEDEPEKEETVSKISGGVVSLKKGTPYQLEEGTWTVSGDTTTYMGGITFYVDEDGEYEFKKQGGQVNE